MRISEVAAKANLDRQTIRYYEKIGLLNKPARTESNYRIYDNSVFRRIKFILCAKEIGFNLNDIKTLLNMADGSIKSCEEVRNFAESRLLKIKERIKNLTAIEEVLEGLVNECRQKNSLKECPILSSLTSD